MKQHILSSMRRLITWVIDKREILHNMWRVLFFYTGIWYILIFMNQSDEEEAKEITDIKGGDRQVGLLLVIYNKKS